MKISEDLHGNKLTDGDFVYVRTLSQGLLYKVVNGEIRDDWTNYFGFDWFDLKKVLNVQSYHEKMAIYPNTSTP